MLSKPILILKTGQTLPSIKAKRGDFENWITTFSGYSETCFSTCQVFRDEKFPAISSISGIIVTGSPAMVTDDSAWIKRSEQYLLEAIGQGLPLLGICFGHQLLAQALGGKVDWHPKGRNIGTAPIQLTGDAEIDPLLSSLPGEILVHSTHMQSAITLPSSARILAGNSFEPHHAVRFGEKVWGLQFHPEFDEGIIEEYIKGRYTLIVEEGLDADALLAAVKPTPESNEILNRFVSLAIAS